MREITIDSELSIKYNNAINLITQCDDNSIPIGVFENKYIVKNNFDESPHILIAGQTGSGKSTMLRLVIDSLLWQNKAHILALDFKGGIELQQFRKCNCIVNNEIIYEYDKAIEWLKRINNIMDDRYSYMREHDSYECNNERIIIIIDELADLTLSSYSRVATQLLTRIAQMGRGAKINMIVCTQKPLVKCVPSLLLANITSRVCLKCASFRESILILDHSGGECLNGRGDAIAKINGNEYVVQVPYVDRYFQDIYLPQFMVK